MRQSRLQILLVDDDDVFCDIVEEVVQRDSRLRGRVALQRLADGQDALEYLARAAPYQDTTDDPWPDLIIMDERMPRLDGTEALLTIRQDSRTGGVPVCLLSSSDRQELVRRAYAVGANFCLVKPFELEELQKKLNQIVEFFSSVVELPRRGEQSLE